MSNYEGQAAVLLVLCHSPEALVGEHLLLTKRSEHLSSHSGEVAFPGGMWDAEDQCLQTTALRESYEEVGLKSSLVEIEGQLPVSFTRHGTKVTPYYGRVYEPPSLMINPSELDALFWVPLKVFQKDQRVKTTIFHLDGREYWAPVYEFDSYTIWGFTARVIIEFMNQQYDLNLTREHSVPEEYFASN